jgi:Ca-activated chloride channel homolog
MPILTLSEGRKVLVEQAGATLFTTAKDVKIQVEFNPPLSSAIVSSVMRRRTSTTIGDAGEIGAGYSVTAFYELVPVGQPLPD